MKIRELRILPPLAIGRMGSAAAPVDNYRVEDDPDHPLEFRRIVGAETLIVDEATGEIREVRVPELVTFKDGDRIRPVAPFLEVFAVTGEDTLEPLTVALLAANGLAPADVSWRVAVANRKLVRRTGDPDDLVHAETDWFSGHDERPLEGHCNNFVAPDRFIGFGHVRYIRPNDDFPAIRLRFMPAPGLIYGSDVEEEDKIDPDGRPLYEVPEERRVYDHTKGWYHFEVPPVVDSGGAPADGEFYDETLPPSLFAIEPPAPSWLNDNIAISRGYLDDACDGIVEVELTVDGEELTARGRITASPPATVPDAFFVRSLADDLDQIMHGPAVPADEPLEVTRARAEDIVRRAFETVRFMNVAVMNGNPVAGRPALSLDTMPAEEAFDTERLERPVMAPGTVDTLAIMALHQQVFAALRGGAAPWFVRLLRQPHEAGDYTDAGRRKMPALMCGADNNYLALTHRQIDTIRRAIQAPAFAPPFGASPPSEGQASGSAPRPALTPRNRSAQMYYPAAGNPESSRPFTAIGNCCPGLEVDFRAVWRRMFKGIVLREYDNLVVEIDPDVADASIEALKGHRLLRVAGTEVMTRMIGPSPADPTQSVVLATENNPDGLAPLEWSNALAAVLHENMGKTVTCDFSKEPSWYRQQPWDGEKGTFLSVEFEVREFFAGDSALIADELAQPGELTQGLCSPWQNDFRECSCYYWASARPDYVNVELAGDGLSSGDNWLQKVRTGSYVPDDYRDARLIDYDDLFREWERLLKFQIGGRDAPETDSSET